MMQAEKKNMISTDLLKKTHKEVTDLVCREFDFPTPKTINYGGCWVWAIIFAKKTGGKLYTIKDHGGHAVVELNGRFYDATTFGVKSWHRMKVFGSDRLNFKNRGSRCFKQNQKDFIKNWRSEGYECVYKKWKKFKKNLDISQKKCKMYR